MVLPEGISLTLWANSLIIDFPYDNVPNLSSESQWQEWGDELANCQNFIDNDIPSTFNYRDWKSWAYDVYFLMCNNDELNAE